MSDALKKGQFSVNENQDFEWRTAASRLKPLAAVFQCGCCALRTGSTACTDTRGEVAEDGEGDMGRGMYTAASMSRSARVRSSSARSPEKVRAVKVKAPCCCTVRCEKAVMKPDE